MNLDLDIRPSVSSFVVIGLMAVVFIVMFKVAMKKWPIPGLSEIANAV